MAVRLVVFDFDGTLIQGFPPEAPYIWRLLHDHHGTPRPALDEQRDRFLAGTCSYDAWFRHDLHWLMGAGATRDSLRASLAPLHRVQGADEVLGRLRESGVPCALLSGSVDLACRHFFPQWPFDAAWVNRLHFDGDGRLVGGESTPYDMGRKADGLADLARRFSVPLQDTAFVGDASNDVDAARMAGLPIAFNCRDPGLAAVSAHVFPAPAPDLRVLLPLLLPPGA